MKYYIVLLKNGTVVDICSFDEEDARDHQKIILENTNPYDAYWDSVQTINIVN